MTRPEAHSARSPVLRPLVFIRRIYSVSGTGPGPEDIERSAGHGFWLRGAFYGVAWKACASFDVMSGTACNVPRATQRQIIAKMREELRAALQPVIPSAPHPLSPSSLSANRFWWVSLTGEEKGRMPRVQLWYRATSRAWNICYFGRF